MTNKCKIKCKNKIIIASIVIISAIVSYGFLVYQFDQIANRSVAELEKKYSEHLNFEEIKINKYLFSVKLKQVKFNAFLIYQDEIEYHHLPILNIGVLKLKGNNVTPKFTADQLFMYSPDSSTSCRFSYTQHSFTANCSGAEGNAYISTTGEKIVEVTKFGALKLSNAFKDDLHNFELKRKSNTYRTFAGIDLYTSALHKIYNLDIIKNITSDSDGLSQINRLQEPITTSSSLALSFSPAVIDHIQAVIAKKAELQDIAHLLKNKTMINVETVTDSQLQHVLFKLESSLDQAELKFNIATNIKPATTALENADLLPKIATILSASLAKEEPKLMVSSEHLLTAMNPYFAGNFGFELDNTIHFASKKADGKLVIFANEQPQITLTLHELELDDKLTPSLVMAELSIANPESLVDGLTAYVDQAILPVVTHLDMVPAQVAAISKLAKTDLVQSLAELADDSKRAQGQKLKLTLAFDAAAADPQPVVNGQGLAMLMSNKVLNKFMADLTAIISSSKEEQKSAK